MSGTYVLGANGTAEILGERRIRTYPFPGGLDIYVSSVAGCALLLCR